MATLSQLFYKILRWKRRGFNRCRRSPISKNEYYRDLLAQAKRNQIPFKYVLSDVWYSAAANRFLDYAAEELNFLQKVGGGYVFIHRYLLEHFAEIAVEKGYVAPAREN